MNKREEHMDNPLHLKLRDNILFQLSKFRAEEYEGLRLEGQAASDVIEILRDIQYDVITEVEEILDEVYDPEFR